MCADIVCVVVNQFFFFKQKTAYEMLRSLVGSEMCIRDRQYHNHRVASTSVASTSAYTDDTDTTALHSVASTTDSTNTKILLQDAILAKLAQAMSNQNSTPVTAVAAFDALRQLSTRRLRKMVTQIVEANGRVSPSPPRRGNVDQHHHTSSPLKRMMISQSSPLHDMLKDMVAEAGIGSSSGNNNINNNAGTMTIKSCLLYTSDAADEEDSVDLGGRRIIKKKKSVKTDCR
eukprot:TRINITY_DN10409_c0_g2_i2.p1 TRINITY_DN10409_c0_g2~~TRINITY_DN10409_c0_g2_i2.p1  ORF type:complete len:231 (+),score=63.51 TRINITY_DN10409_c0_g2_i2:80-772(+)